MSFRVLTALFGHESNAFSAMPTTHANFKDYLFALGDDIPAAIRGARIEPAGVEEAAAKFDWNLVRTVAAWATPSGPVADDAWQVASQAILNAARDQGPFDGALICLHGAMATVHDPDGEGVLLEALRKILGPDVPIAITLDLHANVTTRMADNADIVCAYRTYPHIDQVATAWRAANILQRTMAGEIKPTAAIARRAMLTGLDDGRTTTDNPMTTLLARAEKIEQDDAAVLEISVHAGFSPANLDEAGPSVVVTTDNNAEQAQSLAESFMDYAWDTREFDSNRYLTAEQTIEAVRQLRADSAAPAGPIVIADYSDNPGSGAYGDSTFLLSALIAAGIDKACVGTIYDPQAASELIAAGEGAQATVSLGGKIDPTFGPPITLTGTVVRITDGTYVAQGPRWKGVTHRLGPTAVFAVDGVEIIVVSNRVQLTELEAFTHAGIDPAQRAVVVVKSMQHFRAAFAPIARETLICDAGALSSKDLSRLPYTRLRRPIFPLDEMA